MTPTQCCSGCDWYHGLHLLRMDHHYMESRCAMTIAICLLLFSNCFWLLLFAFCYLVFANCFLLIAFCLLLISFAHRNVEMRDYFTIDNNVINNSLYWSSTEILANDRLYQKKKKFSISNKQRAVSKYQKAISKKQLANNNLHLINKQLAKGNWQSAQIIKQ